MIRFLASRLLQGVMVILAVICGALRSWLLAGLLWPAAATAQATAQAAAQPPSELQVQLWAASCMACHGPEGRAIGTGLAIGGRPAEELLAKLRGYKSGELPATIMHQHAKGYSDDELARIAAYFASLK